MAQLNSATALVQLHSWMWTIMSACQEAGKDDLAEELQDWILELWNDPRISEAIAEDTINAVRWA